MLLRPGYNLRKQLANQMLPNPGGPTMSESSVPTLSDLPLHEAEAIEKACTRFEDDWKAWRDGPPRVEAYLDQADGPSRDILLAELIRLEIAYRVLQGETPHISEYRQRFPDQTWLDEVLQAAGCTLDGTPGEMLTGHREDESITLTPREEPDAGFGIPGYELLQRLEPGGMGVVYKARHKGLNRIVALKMILTGEHADETARARFKTEAETIARLQHPGIVQIFEVGELPTGNGGPPRPFIALEFCPGGNLDKKLGGTPRQPMEAAALVEQLARAMQAAHEAHVLHRDLKPANVLLAGDGTPKITDFGLAKKLDEEGKTQTGDVMGTPSYMAPEQAQGKNKELGPACDVYALGTILYECLTGRPPFKAATMMDTLMQVVHDEPVAPSRLNAKVPTDLETICLKCLSKDPAKRYDSALSLAEDLARFQRHEPIVARPVGRPERLWRWCRRNPSLAAALVGLLVGTVLSTYFALQFYLTAWEAARRTTELAEQKQATELALKASELQRKRSDVVAYASRIESAKQAFLRGECVGAQQILLTCDPKLRGWEYDFVLGKTLPRLNLSGHTGSVTSVDFSPDGKRIVSASKDTLMKVWDARSGVEILTIKGHLDGVTSVNFSADGKRIASGSKDKTVRVWDAQTGVEVLCLMGHMNEVTSVAFHPNGKQLVSGSEDKTLTMWDCQTGEEILVFKGHTEGVLSVAFSADGKRIVSGGRDKRVMVWDAKTGETLLTLKNAHMGSVASVNFSPDCKRIVSGGIGFTVKVWDVNTGQAVLTLDPNNALISGLSFSPDGTRIAGAMSDHITVKVWDTRTGEELLSLGKGHPGAHYSSVAFSPDGTRVVAGTGTFVEVWEGYPEEETFTLEGHKGSVWSIAISPDGTRIVSADDNSLTVKVWDTQTEEVLSLKGHKKQITKVCLSPDGRRIVSGSRDGEIKVWDAQTGKLLLSLKELTDLEADEQIAGKLNLSLGAHTDWVTFSPDGQRIVSGGCGTVKAWDAHTGEKTLSMKIPEFNILALSPDGKRIVTTKTVFDRMAGEFIHPVIVRDVPAGKHLLTLKGHALGVTCASFSPDGYYILTGGGDKAVKVWDAQTGEEVVSLKGHTVRVRSVAFSPDGTRIVSGGGDLHMPGELKVWDATTGEQTLSLKGHTHPVLCLAISHDSRCIVSGSADATIKGWEVLAGDESLSLNGHTREVWSLAFSPDSTRIVRGGGTFGMAGHGRSSGTGTKNHSVQDTKAVNGAAGGRSRPAPTPSASGWPRSRPASANLSRSPKSFANTSEPAPSPDKWWRQVENVLPRKTITATIQHPRTPYHSTGHLPPDPVR